MTTALFRIVTVAAGYLLACLAGIATLIFAASETDLFTVPAFPTTFDLFYRAATVAGLVADAPVVTVAALGLAAVVVAEIIRVRACLWHILFWGAAAAVAAGASRWLWDMPAPAGIGDEVMIAFVASGFVAGFVYWLVAGRTV